MSSDVARDSKKPTAPTDSKKDKKQEKDDELSDDDKQLQSELDMLLERLTESDTKLYKPALESLRTLIRSSTTSMTSVPKPLKFLRPHYTRIKAIYEKMEAGEPKRLCADIISVLAMTMVDTAGRKYDTLRYRFVGSTEEIGAWGHEYVRHLTGQIVSLFQSEEEEEGEERPSDSEVVQIHDLIDDIIPYHMENNAEAEAIDLCIELEKLEKLKQHTGAETVQRVCLYLTSCVPYLPNPENDNVLMCAYELYREYGDLGNALRCALSLNRPTLVSDTFRRAGAVDAPVQKQLAFLIARHQYTGADWDEFIDDLPEDVVELLSNAKLSEYFLALARELDIMEPKVPEDIYKSSLDQPRSNISQVDSARTNLSASYVNAMINCGFCQDKLTQDEADTKQKWIYRHKEAGITSAVASLGWLWLWNVENGLTSIDKYMYHAEARIKAGALQAVGIVSTGVRDEHDPALALIADGFEEAEVAGAPAQAGGGPGTKAAAVIGLGVAYAGTRKTAVLEMLSAVVSKVGPTQTDLELACLAALSMGMVATGTLNSEVTCTILQTMMDVPSERWRGSGNDPPEPLSWAGRLICLGLGLACIGLEDSVEVVLCTLDAVKEPLRSAAHLMCEACAYAGSGNVLKVQELLHVLSDKWEDRDKDKEASATGDTEKEKGGEAAKQTAASASGGAGEGKTAAETAKPKEKPADAPEATAEDTTSTTMETTDATETGTSEPMETTEDAEVEGGGEDGADEDDGVTYDYLPHQGLACLGLAVISMGDETSQEMAYRMFGHLLRFGETRIRRAVPLALALAYASNPQLKVLDTLSKFSHDSDPEIAHNAILAMGIVGAGTNNARLAAMLRLLAVYHGKDPANLFMVRLAQGLTHLGKGTLSLAPFHSDRFLLSAVNLSGLLAVLVASLDVRKTLLDKYDALLYYLTPAIQPRLLMTFDTELKPLAVSVRVGQAVDVVGQAGRPKTITGFQTHTTPVLLSYGERAELATEEYLPVTSIPMEGFIILKKNPDYEA